MSEAKTTDMTQGSPLKHLIIFSLPLLLGNLFQQFYNMVDSLIVGNYVGKEALAAVGACGSMNFLFFSLNNGLGVGIGVIVAQYFGAKQDTNVKKAIANSYYVLFSVSALITMIGYTLSPFLLRFLNTPDSILASSTTYMRITCLGILGISLYNGVSSMLRALGDSKSPLYFLIFSSVTNVVLDLIFVLKLNMGVSGVALATIISQYLSAISCMIYAHAKMPLFRLDKSLIAPDKIIIGKSFRLGIPLGLQGAMIAVSCMALQGYANTFGENAIAAFSITGRIEQIIHQPFTSLGSAVTTFSGQNKGANDNERIKKGFNQATLVVLALCLIFIPVAHIFGKTIVSFFVKDPEVISLAYRALKITSLCYFPLGMIYIPRALMNGCGDSTFALINGFAEVVCRILYSKAFMYFSLFGVWGIWITNAATWTTTCIVCMIRYWQGKWKSSAITD